MKEIKFSQKNKSVEDCLIFGKIYTKKPIPITAVQVFVPFKVDTLEGTMRGKAGDFLVEGINGELYICDKDIFMESYTEVKE